MDPVLLQILRLALGVVTVSTGGVVKTVAEQILNLEQLAAAVNHKYTELQGQPLDLSLLKYQPPIE